MRRPILLFILAVGPWPLLAEEAPPAVVQRDRAGVADTVHAATSRAVAGLYDQIGQMPLTPRLTVAAVLKDLELEEEFLKVLERADQLGAPRWLDEHTCQVQLQVPVSRITYGLRQLAAAYPKRFPVTPVQIELAARNWPRQVFIATGTSASTQALVELRPPMSPKWAVVSETERRRVLSDASADASQRALQSVSTVRLSNQKTVGQTLQIPEVRQAVHGWLSTRPVTRVDFQEDLEVEVALGVDERDFFSVYRSAVTRQESLPLPKGPEEWRQLERDFSSHFRMPVGRSSVEQTAPVRPAAVLPSSPPEWAGERVDIEGTAPDAGGKLRTRCAAEMDAMARLQARINALPLDEKLTVGDAAQRDPRLAEALRRAARSARIYKTQYNPDGSATVSLSADLGSVWEELRRASGE